MEGLVEMFWNGKRVFVTGHSGFKGGWLSLWLQHAGSHVAGYSLQPPSTPSLFQAARIADDMESTCADIRDLPSLRSAVAKAQPEIVFHLAAQPLVRQSYDEPLETYATNILGTANVLEAVRGVEAVRAVVVITTDKCYRNQEWVWGYRESDELGGHDPYSSSKACAEMIVSSYRQSFFNPSRYSQHRVAIASVRAGNVIGGGDWANDRLVPDIIRAFLENRSVRIRFPKSVRPWQHVLEPVRGYLRVAQRLFDHGPAYGEAWNFGPDYSDARPVDWIVERLAQMWGPTARWELDGGEHPHETKMLRLDWSKAAAQLEWRPLSGLSQALEMTVDWYKAWAQQKDMRAFTMEQIERYVQVADSSEPAMATGVGH
jgi:CDP-glucose 4,6-dehydratase